MIARHGGGQVDLETGFDIARSPVPPGGILNPHARDRPRDLSSAADMAWRSMSPAGIS